MWEIYQNNPQALQQFANAKWTFVSALVSK